MLKISQLNPTNVTTNQFVSGYVVATLTITDADATSPNNNIVSVTIPQAVPFEINANKQIVVKSALNYTTQSSFSFTVVARDGGVGSLSRSTTAQVSLTITTGMYAILKCATLLWHNKSVVNDTI